MPFSALRSTLADGSDLVDRVMAKEFEQVTIKFDPQDCAALKRVAAAEDRSLSAQVRHLVAKALREYTQEERAA